VTLRYGVGDSLSAVDLNQFVQLYRGFAWISGCGLLIGDSRERIEIDVAPGTVLFDGSDLGVPAQTAVLDPNETGEPRVDLLWVNRDGEVIVESGPTGEYKPPGTTGRKAWNPPPPSFVIGTGVVLATVTVPPQATESGQVYAEDHLTDRRLAFPSVQTGQIPVVDGDPPDSQLQTTQWWFNEATSQLRSYLAPLDEVHSLNTTLERSLSGPTTALLEGFETDHEPRWRGATGYFYRQDENDSGPTALEGEWTAEHRRRDLNYCWSFPGDGLPLYARPGDTIRLAARLEDEAASAVIIWSKEADTREVHYELQASRRRDELLFDANSTSEPDRRIDAESYNFTEPASGLDGYIVCEVEYDGGGKGIHPMRVTDNNLNTLVEIPDPPMDLEFRGGGLGFGAQGQTTLDSFQVIRPR